MKLRSRTIEIELKGATREVPTYDRMLASRLVPALTIVRHPRIARVGERARLPALLEADGQVELSRLTPELAPPFSPPGASTLPLATSFLSRRPIVLSAGSAGAIVIDAAQAGTSLLVDGEPVAGRLELARARVERGVVLELAGQVVLLLHLLKGPSEPAAAVGAPTDDDEHGLGGASDALLEVREAVARVAPLPGPVLLRGATGTGKELVARALHAAGPRRDKPFVAINMAAIAPTLAASELFGHVRGAFSGAHQANLGVFGRADGGTLLLDEIGDTPLDVQAALLRVLETGEVQQVGADRVRHVDVHLVAATDADLEGLVRAGRFRAPLRYRLSSQAIQLPTLAERRDDIGRLLVRFVGLELQAMGRGEELDDQTAEGTSWIPAPLMARLARHPWPGNVRQLKSVARWLASLDHRARPVRPDDPSLDGLLGDDAGDEARDAGMSGQVPDDAATLAEPAAKKRRSPSDIGEDELEALMERHDYKLGAVADALGVSRPALNELVDAHPRLVRAQSLTKAEIVAAMQRHGGDIGQMWRALRVSEKSLKLRMSALALLGPSR